MRATSSAARDSPLRPARGPPLMERQVGDRLVAWFLANGRELPWRGTSDPYRIWVAEVLLQQTRVEQARPYYERFLRAFPTLGDLARARVEEVLKVWEGAGYYGRARRMQAAAQLLHARPGDPWPRSVAELELLPGFGPYTARSVSALAFGTRTIALDANALRVLARLFLLRPFDRSTARRAEERGMVALQGHPPRAFNEGLMEIGQRFCTARAPRCGACPLGDLCLARRELPDPATFPPASPRARRPRVEVAVGILRRGSRILLDRRPEEGLLGGMWELPGGKLLPGEAARHAVVREFREETGLSTQVVRALGVVEHDYSHFHVTLHVFLLEGGGRPRSRGPVPLRWAGPEELRRLPLPAATRRILERTTWKMDDPPPASKGVDSRKGRRGN